MALDYQNLYQKDWFGFQQDSAQFHKATRNQEWLIENVPNFVTSHD
jgi:hypothetical protein